MSKTLDSTLDASMLGSQEIATEPPAAWVLTLAGCPEPALLGRRCVLEPGTPLCLGRGGDALGPGGLDDRRLSRRHASIELDEHGPRLRDLGSHNGSRVNGAKIETARLSAGDVITLGRTVLLLHRAPARLPSRSPIAELVGCGQSHLALVDAVHKVAARSTTILLLGPSGAGKTHLARVIHAHSGRSGPARTIHCGGVPDERVFELLAPNARASEGTSILEGVDEAGPGLQARLLALIDAAEPSSERIVATAQVAALEQTELRRDLIQRLTRWIVHLPPLGSRPEDIALLARLFVRRYLGEDLPLHPTLSQALLRHRWPGNIRELEAVIECLCIDADVGASSLRLTPGVRTMLARREPPNPSEQPGPEGAAPPALVVDSEGRWFALRGRDRVEIGHRKTLARVLAALVAQRVAAPGVASSMAELLATGWPDERVLERAGANRVHVALTSLRKLGLRELLLRRDEGYLIDPEVQVQVQRGGRER